MELPHPWELRESTRYPGRCFYFNRETSESQWIRPVPYPGHKIRCPPIIYVYHILIRDSTTDSKCRRSIDEAKSEIDQLFIDLIEKKRTFEEMARRKSEDDATRSDGGKIGWIKPGKMPIQFENAAWQLDICEMSAPVHTDQGWHLILRRG